MKKFVLFSLVVVALLSVAWSSAFAAVGVVVDVPFAFVVGGKTLGAGHYSLEKSFRGGQGILMIRNSEGTVVQIVLCTTSNARHFKPQVEFIKSGENYVLATVLTTESDIHIAAARQAAKKLKVAAR
jgi:hypothetical protein